MLNAASRAPGADPASGARPMRDAWAWVVLPASPGRIAASGGSLPDTLRAAGAELLELGDQPDTVLADAANGDHRLDWAALGSPEVVVAIGGGADVVNERSHRVRRAAQIVRGHVAVAGTRRQSRVVAAQARAAGRAISSFETGDRSRPYTLGAGSLRQPQAGSVVRASLTARRETALQVAVAAVRAAAPDLGEAGTMRVVESGKVIFSLSGDDGAPGAVVRLAGGPASALLDRAVNAAAVLSGPSAPSLVSAAMPAQIAAGRAGLVSFSAERWAPGAHPQAGQAETWQCGRAFLEALRGVPGSSAKASDDIVAADLALLGPLLSRAARTRLDEIGKLVAAELSGVQLGWAHGDFWLENLVIEGGQLVKVLDWDTAQDDELPALDALDLLGFQNPHARWTTFGPRLVDYVLPLARGCDERLVAHCRAVGSPSDRRGLEALAWAWWMRRTALTVRDYPDRRARPLWLRENLELPLLSGPG